MLRKQSIRVALIFAVLTCLYHSVCSKSTTPEPPECQGSNLGDGCKCNWTNNRHVVTKRINSERHCIYCPPHTAFNDSSFECDVKCSQNENCGENVKRFCKPCKSHQRKPAVNINATIVQNDEQPPYINPTVDNDGTNVSIENDEEPSKVLGTNVNLDKTVDLNEALQPEEIKENKLGHFNANTSTNLSEGKQEIIVHNAARDRFDAVDSGEHQDVDLEHFPDKDLTESPDHNLKDSPPCENSVPIVCIVLICLVLILAVSVVIFVLLYLRERKKNSEKPREELSLL